ncbi:MAG TPA: DNA mismatch repair endonuclease MutL, partial [Candidatus Babeliales bacterium]|nr:DNA mismatch repair endonuclease MutL [Candidatus Babeliales bacterium]
MAKIKQLPPHEAQKIAAGEVVERPANIVKELIENAIDAGATRIAMYVEDAGKQLIRIVDNGCGMDTTDAQLCFNRHATSKITHVDQLETIDTFGFRGEALASIASVSQITLITKEEQSLEGTKVMVTANNITEINSIACTTGTDITINNLFFNLPARKKFLKTTQTEWRAIQLLFNAFCFDYPHIHFLLFADGKQVFNCPLSLDLQQRALQIWEGQATNHLLELQANEKDFSLSGVISDHQYYRYDRSSMYFFVNKRWVKNQHISNAFIKGYANVIPTGRYPVGIIHITIPAHEVDINIHPRKEEVKFLHPRRVEQALQQAVKHALEKNLSLHLKKDVTFQAVPQYTTHTNNFNFDLPFAPFDPAFAEASAGRQAFTPEHSRRVKANRLDNHTNTIKNVDEINSSRARSEPVEEYLRALEETLQQVQGERKYETVQLDLQTQSKADISLYSVPTTETYRLIGQYNTTYILVEKEDGLFLVDQHAAHERILYELFSQRFKEVATIQLLFPHIITLSSQDMSI